MIVLLTTVLAASTVKSIGAVIAVITIIGFAVYVAINVRAGGPEISSEVELAPNRKPYFDDEALEGPRLTRALGTGLVLLGVVAIGLPLYWLNEPGRMQGAIDNFDQTFINRGERLFAPTADGGYNCAGCHGTEGVGGQTPFTLNDADGKFVAEVTWKAPALDTVLLRFDKEELRQILTFGRPGTPMPAWGVPGGGPLTVQQIDELVAYIGSIQLTSKEAQAQAEELLRADLGLEPDAEIDYTDPLVGEAIFNLGLESGGAGGAYSCGRCHTKGASFEHGTVVPADADLSEYAGFPDGSGAFGPALDSGEIPRQFLDFKALLKFVHDGSKYGILYGQRGQGTGRMPGLGDNPDDADDETDDRPDDGMFSPGMLQAVVCYEASLGVPSGGTRPDECSVFPQPTTTTTTEAE